MEVDSSAAERISGPLARYLGSIPVALEEGAITIAVWDPDDDRPAEVVRAITGLDVHRVIATPRDIEEAQRRVYGTRHLRADGARARPAVADSITLAERPERGLTTLGFRLWVLPGIALLVWGLFALQNALWPEGRVPGSIAEQVVSWAGYVWAVPIVPALLALAGLVTYRKPVYPRRTLTPIENLVSFRIVARGENAFRLRQTIESIRAEMVRLPLFPFVIEVVTDLAVDLGNHDLLHYVVPSGFRTARGSRFKARALEYAVEQSRLPEDAWILHLDEESYLTPSLITGIHAAISEEEATGEHRIGQGAILYHRDLPSRPFLSLADSIRTGDDLGRFHLQHRLGVTLFGLHGSFILVRNSLEREVGFDFGPLGSITEDSFWALEQMERGHKCRWIDGYVAEQAPRTVRDFVRQRRRWFVGLVKVVTEAPVPLRYRLALAVSTSVWSISWIGILYLYVNLATGFGVPLWVQSTGNVAFAVYIMSYVIGLRTNLENLPPIGPLRTAFLYVAQVVLIPAFALLEAAGVLYGLVRPETGFHVIRK